MNFSEQCILLISFNNAMLVPFLILFQLHVVSGAVVSRATFLKRPPRPFGVLPSSSRIHHSMDIIRHPGGLVLWNRAPFRIFSYLLNVPLTIRLQNLRRIYNKYTKTLSFFVVCGGHCDLEYCKLIQVIWCVPSDPFLSCRKKKDEDWMRSPQLHYVEWRNKRAAGGLRGKAVGWTTSGDQICWGETSRVATNRTELFTVERTVIQIQNIQLSENTNLFLREVWNFIQTLRYIFNK